MSKPEGGGGYVDVLVNEDTTASTEDIQLIYAATHELLDVFRALPDRLELSVLMSLLITLAMQYDDPRGVLAGVVSRLPDALQAALDKRDERDRGGRA